MSVAQDKIVAKIAEVNALIDRSSYLVNDGSRDLSILRAESRFVTGESSVGEMVFNVPKDADFYGQRLNLFLQRRLISQTAPTTASEKTFRPVNWTSTCEISSIDEFKDANALFELRDSMHGPYSSGPMNVACAFSCRAGVPFAGPNVSSYIGGLDFCVPYHVRRGHTASVTLNPMFSLTSAETVKNEFRVVGQFFGFKKVRAFK